MTRRTATLERKTRETTIRVELDVDGCGDSTIETPLPFLSHMLDHVAQHSKIDLAVTAQGDVEIDGHHTTEDLGLVLGRALLQALGDRTGIRRYGSATVPMDEALITAAVDLSGRPFFVYDLVLPKAKVGDWDSELGEVFFEALARGAQMNLHLKLHHGSNLHHILEGSFKAFAHALRQATERDPRSPGVPSTKGMLD